MHATNQIEGHRPGAIKALVVLKAISGLAAVATGVFLIAVNADSDQAADIGLGAGVLVIGLVTVLLAVGLWMLRSWARKAALVLAPVFILASIAGVIGSGGRDPGTYISIVAEIFTLYVLLNAKWKRLYIEGRDTSNPRVAMPNA